MSVLTVIHRRHAKELSPVADERLASALWDAGPPATEFYVLGHALMLLDEPTTERWSRLDLMRFIQIAASGDQYAIERAVNCLRAAVELEAPGTSLSDHNRTKQSARLLLACGARRSLLLAAGVLMDEPVNAA